MKKFSDIDKIVESDDTQVESNQYDVVKYLIDEILNVQVDGVRDPIIANNTYINGKEQLAMILIKLFNNKSLLKTISSPNFTLNIMDIYNALAETNEDYINDIKCSSDIMKLESLLEVSNFFNDNNIISLAIQKRISELNYGKN